jgi:hypothetical protein
VTDKWGYQLQKTFNAKSKLALAGENGLGDNCVTLERQ